MKNIHKTVIRILWMKLFRLSKRIDAIDEAFGTVILKTSSAVERMAAMEKEVEEKREIMDDFFDPKKSEEELREMVDQQEQQQ